MTVKKAAVLVANSQPLMHSCIQPRPVPRTLWFVPMNKQNYDIQEKENTDWEVELRQQLLTRYDIRKGPLWSLTFLPNSIVIKGEGQFTNECTLVFACHHAIADGMSVMRIMAQVINTTDKIMSGTSTPYLPQKIMHASVDESIDRMCYKEKVWDFSRSDYIDTEFKVTHIELSRDETNILIAQCHCEGATIQGAAMAASILAMKTFFLQENRETVNLVTANSRKFLKLPDDAIGACPYLMHIPLKMAKSQQTSFWEEAKCCSKEVHEKLNRETCIDYFVSKMQFIPTDSMSIVFSNRGNCNFVNEKCSSVKAVACYGITGARISYPMYFYHSITTVDKQLCWTLTYYTKYVSSRASKK